MNIFTSDTNFVEISIKAFPTGKSRLYIILVDATAVLLHFCRLQAATHYFGALTWHHPPNAKPFPQKSCNIQLRFSAVFPVRQCVGGSSHVNLDSGF